MQLNPRQLEAFRMVMLRGSATAAARALGITQPAVSRLLRDLEVRTGLALFERRANVLVPTPEASLLLVEVERYASGISAIASFTEELRQRRRGSLSIVAMPALAMSFLPSFVAGFVEGRDLDSVLVHGMPSHLVIDALLAGQFEVGIAASPPERPGLNVETIRADLVVAMPSGHRLAARREIKAADLAGERIIALSDPLLFSYTTSPALGRLSHQHAALTTPLSGIACCLVASGTGIAIVDPFSVSDYIGRGVVVRPFKPVIRAHIAILTNAHRPTSAITREFIAGFRRHAEQSARRLTNPPQARGSGEPRGRGAK
ncbi:MAG: LysR family transcriptional regulator [Hyphomicrobiaceae bacterium]